MSSECSFIKVSYVIFFGLILAGLWAAFIWVMLGKPSSVCPPSVTPPPSSAPSTPTPTHCPCLNNGICQNGVCFCTDEWKGEVCEIANFCNSSTSVSLTFDRILIGYSGYSKEECEENTANAGIPKATRRCLLEAGVLTLSEPVLMDCNEGLDRLVEQVTNATGDELVKIASNTQMLTSQPEKLTVNNITTAADIANRILTRAKGNESEMAAVAAVTTISQLLDAKDAAFENNDVAIVAKSLTETLEAFSLENSNNITGVVQPNLAVQSLTVNSSLMQGVQFTALRGENDTLISKRIEINSNASNLIMDRNAEVQIFLNFTTVNNTDGQLGFVLYQNDKFFRSRFYSSTIKMNRRVISGSFSAGVLNSIDLLFVPNYNSSGISFYDYACVFWDYTLSDWNTEGCTKTSDDDKILKCHCNHTTNFAVLMTFKNNYKYSKPLEVISIVGCSFSMAGLLITVLFYIITRKSRKQILTIMLVSICISLLIFNIIFVIGINNPNPSNMTKSSMSRDNNQLSTDLYIKPDKGYCTFFTALLHYFLLATFVWTLLYAVQMFLLLVLVFSYLPSYFTWTVIGFGWGVPAVIVAVTLGASYRINNPLNYRQEEFCWLAALDIQGKFDISKPMLWAFLLPMALILLCNFAVFVCVLIRAIFKKNSKLTSTKRSSYKKKLLGSFSIAIILGISWVLGYLMLIDHRESQEVFSYLFCILNVTQGFQIFIFFTARSKTFRKSVSSAFSSLSVSNIFWHSINFDMKRFKTTSSRETYKQFEPSTTSAFTSTST
ncbi:adhesion G-protein coupled receptor G7 [Erpetoichthys calabaricus]|uniref:Adhesion G protein-coupled receptor G7 n=1 Tax=Erpetoichthys calabaricus TaxID=27687 RepID=A0A8C4SJ25_ERPCA|nr:adhesion G-protein coupled receptor G7 [Erpetoichthys calabaricus]